LKYLLLKTNMNRRERATKRDFLGKIRNLRFKLNNLTIPNQIVIFLCIVWIASLFMPWVIDKENSISWNAFNSISWNIGYIMIIIYIILLFLMISSTQKEKIKLYTDLNFKNHFLIISSGLASICFWIIMVSFVNGLSAVWQNIVHWNGLILSMAIWILICIFGILIRNDYKKVSSEIILQQLNGNREKAKEKDNMTLPI
jgi:small-conductance mechanosensitive channel